MFREKKQTPLFYFLCLFFATLSLGRQEARAQEEILEKVREDRFLYCDDLVETCPNPADIANLLVTYEIYSGESKTYISAGYYDFFKSRLAETWKLGLIQNLWLDGNFKTLPAEVAKLTKLQTLVIEFDSIAEIPAFVQNLPAVESLLLENTRLLPIGISNFKKLKYLKIRAPKVIQLSKDIGDIKTLQTLVVLENKMPEMHPAVGKLQNLEELYWTGGQLTTLPASIGGLKNLRELHLPTNQISNLPPEIGDLQSLEVLNLYANRLRSLPAQIIKLTNLKKLDLKGNTFDDLEITPELYAFFLRLNNGNNEVIGFLMDKFRMQEQITKEKIEKEGALQQARANEAEAKRQAEEARANKAEALQISEQLKGQKLERIALLEKQKANIAETKSLQAENDKKNALIAAKQSELETEQAKRNLYFLVIGVFFLVILGAIILINLRKQRRLNQALEIQKRKADQLLLSILPEEIAHELKEKGFTEVKYFESASVLFADVQGFSRLAKELSPQDLIKELDLCFSAFDEIAEKNNLERIKTIGDNYMCAGGVPKTNQTHPHDITRAAIEMQRWMAAQEACRLEEGKSYWKIRIGIHTGELVAGVIGKTKFAYDLWGDTVNTASRMESAGESSKVNISESTYLLIKDQFVCTPRGEVEAKNIGLIKAYFVEGIKKM